LLGMKIYTVNFIMVKNTDATLTDIKVNGISLDDFDPQIFEYSFELPYTEFEVPVVSATPAYPNAQIVINQINTVTGIVTITVTAEDPGFMEVYTVHITRELSPINTVESIAYDYEGQSFSYIVNENETEVTIMLPAETEGEPVITNVLLTDSRADYEILEQPGETNDFTGTIKVTAEDLTEETYYVAFERTPSESTLLLSIFYNDIPLPGFDPEIYTYYVILPYNNSQIPVVSATAAWVNTGVAINQATTPFGQASVTVTSEDGQNTQIYTIIFQRKGNPLLVALSYNLDGTSIPVPGFDPSTFVYDIALPLATVATPVLEYILDDERCAVYPTQQNEPNGTSQLKIVTWNLDDSVTYTVNFTVTLSTEALLIDLLVNGVTIDNFNSTTYHYTKVYDYGTTELPVVSAVASQPDAQTVITQINNYPGVATVLVTAGVTTITRTYTVAFSVEAGDNTYLKEILINGAPLPEFDKNTYFYKKEVPYGMPVPVVTATPADPRSTVEIEPEDLQYGDTVKIWVTAINGNMALYQVFFVHQNNNPYPKMIYIDMEPLEGFSCYKTEYDYYLPVNYTGEPFPFVEMEDPNATWEKKWLHPLQLAIIATAENGKDQITYNITFHRWNSIDSNDQDKEIRVYPNPTSDIIHFVVEDAIQKSSMEIFSMEGKKIGSYILEAGTNTVSVEHFQKGIYFYKIFTEETMLGVGKFIKN